MLEVPIAHNIVVRVEGGALVGYRVALGKGALDAAHQC